ncbi:hypothetical protein E2C01_041568 [Portunus trituberculatus]|uniref:Uncharacterized protein n=1 Tax=Portunus trituberculatus TaxID=210409 RepID=A0A5B7FKB5_PORTR|nr:hypothetical protein [Portunus trituberculatus]
MKPCSLRLNVCFVLKSYLHFLLLKKRKKKKLEKSREVGYGIFEVGHTENWNGYEAIPTLLR